jgi:hypothetical protein
MKYINKFEELSESFWNDNFGKATVKDEAHDSLMGKGFSHTKNYDAGEVAMVFNGQEFYQDQIEYADYGDLGEIPRIEGGKLIVANPAWNL